MHNNGQLIQELKRRISLWVLPAAFFLLSISWITRGTIEAVLYNSYLNIFEHIIVLCGFTLVTTGHHILVFRWSLEHIRSRVSISFFLILGGLLIVVAGSQIGAVTMELGVQPILVYGLFLGFISIWYSFAYLNESGILREKMDCPSCGKMLVYGKDGDRFLCRFCGVNIQTGDPHKKTEVSLP